MKEEKVTGNEKLKLIREVQAVARHVIALNGGKDIVLVPENEDAEE